MNCATLLGPALVWGMVAVNGHAQPQSDSHAAAFEVASVKPSAIPGGREGGSRSRIEHTPTSLTMLNVTLTDCVQWAYGVAFFQVSAAHAQGDRYDIRAKTGSATPVSQLRIMLQELLARRFKLEVHRESRMLPVYELVVAKGGPKLRESKAGASHAAVHAAEALPRIRDDAFVFTDVSMREFAEMLTQLRGIDLPVVDHTGVKGNFDIELKGAPNATRDGDSVTLFGIIQDQLGIKLVRAKAPIEVVVIDRAERPSQN